MKLIRDCGVLEDEEHEQDLKNFLKINEFSERAQDQKFYMQILEEINIKEHFLVGAGDPKKASSLQRAMIAKLK